MQKSVPRIYRRLLCILILALPLLLSVVAAAAQGLSADRAIYSSFYVRAFSRCFDSHSNPLPGPLEEFIREGNAELSRPHGDDSNFDKQILLFLLAEAHIQQGEWKEAEPLLLRITTAPLKTETGYLSDYWFHFTGGANFQLAGLYAKQNRWGLATRYYLFYQRQYYLHNVLPMVALCLGFLALWHLGEKARTVSPMAPACKRRLLLCCFFPLGLALYHNTTSLLYSSLLTGNPIEFITSHRVRDLIQLMDSAGYVTLLLAAAWLFRKKSGLPRTGEEVSQTPDATPTKTAGRSKLRRSRIFTLLIVTLIGLLFGRIGLHSWVIHQTLTLPDSIRALQKMNALDGLWLIGLLLTAVLGPIGEEVFYRGVVYPYARRAGGIGFGLVFSALVFAGIHLRMDDFTNLFWAGLLFAAQYEVSRSLLPSTVTHGIGNLLIYIGESLR